jgi:hypothetical protein
VHTIHLHYPPSHLNVFSSHVLETVDRSLRDIQSSDSPFGGITIVLGGDFQQMLPVMVHGTQEDTILATVQHSQLWMNISVLHLTINMHLNNNPLSEQFACWLLDVGRGATVDANTGSGSISIPHNMICTDQDNLIHSLYGKSQHTSIPAPEYFYSRVLLMPLNDDIHKLNAHILQLFPGDVHTFPSADIQVIEWGAEHSANVVPVEFLNSLNASGLPIANLELKQGCPIILLRNLDNKCGLCNGMRATITHMSNRVLQVHLLGGNHNGNITFIPRITLPPLIHGVQFAIHLKCRQFPVQLAFAMTINWSQGQSVQHVTVDLCMPPFAHGQLYVAFSHVTASNNIKVLLPSDTPIQTTNVVYPEILLR